MKVLKKKQKKTKNKLNLKFMDNIYVIGHKSPDLDSVAAAISYANFKNQINETDFCYYSCSNVD